jgi:CubicO group peptidase (beta-lactamase class C family)
MGAGVSMRTARTALAGLVLAAGGAVHASDATFTDQGLAAIRSLVDGAVREGRIPSAVAMLARDGGIVWLHTAGEMGPGVPMREDAILPLASVGKMHTAVAAMILSERGVIALDDPVSKYIPEFARLALETTDAGGVKTRVPPAAPVTIRHLLTHTGGLTVGGDAFRAAWDAHAGRTTALDLARALAELPLQSQPGAKYDYGQTGASYEVLGAVIEIASGRTLEAFLQENLFGPLGLSSTHFFPPPEQAALLPASYRQSGGVLTPVRPFGQAPPRTTFVHGGGGIASSPQDLARFSRLFLDGGTVDGVRILWPETVRMMMSDQLGPRTTFPGGLTWGIGAAVRLAPDGTTTQYGWSGGGYATFIIDTVGRTTSYFAFPLTSPGDNALLTEFRRLVREATRPAVAAGP